MLYGENGAIVGVATGDMGVGRDGKPTENFVRGMELRGKYTFFAEGARGSLTKQLIARFDLAQRQRSAEVRHRHQGAVARSRRRSTSPDSCSTRSAGRSTTARAAARSSTTTARAWLSVGFVLHLNYENPYLSPFEEFQRFKTHPAIRGTFEGGKRIGYGSRALTEGGWQSIPELVIPRRRAASAARPAS